MWTSRTVVAPLGPSPHARGSALHGLSHSSGLGSIPAHAGNSCRRSSGSSSRRVHPRGRGEHSLSAEPTASKSGPPPRAALGIAGEPERGGSIPACAGSRPRPVYCCTPGVGPSPQARGTRDRPWMRANVDRGPSPRTRGTVQPPLSRRRGSSPRAQAADHGVRGRRPDDGTIPASTGNSPMVGRPSSGSWVHPREHALASRVHPRRAQEAGGALNDGEGDGGSIPACAGSSRWRRRTSAP